MAVSTELINTTLADLKGPLEDNFTRYNELMEKLFSKKQVKFAGGTYIERPFIKGATGRAKAIRSGSELLNRVRTKQTEKLQVQPGRFVHTLHIPNIELAQNTGPAAAVSLLKEYPVNDLEALQRDMNKYFLTGSSEDLAISSADMYSFLTLNGQFSSGVGTGVTNGILDFAAPSAQTDTVEGVAKSEAGYHYNQYGAITNWATNGVRTWKKVLRTCAKHGKHKDAKSYVIFTDDVTFGNYEDSRSNAIRVRLVSDATETDATFELSLMGAMVCHSLDLDPSLFTGDAANGVTYMVDTDYCEFQVVEALKLSDFKESEDQDVVYAKAPFHGNWIFTRLPAHGCVAGGN